MIVAAKILDGRNIVSIITIPGPGANSFYWTFGPSYCNLPYKILRHYKDDESTEDILMHFYKTYNVPKSDKSKQSAGWLSPDGAFFPCHSWEHDDLADHLSAIYYDSIEGTRALEDKKWIRVHYDGTTSSFAKTQDQLNTVADLQTVGNDKWKRCMKQVIDYSLI
jgi:hypothetical protein